jgi:hypothetical protein
MRATGQHAFVVKGIVGEQYSTPQNILLPQYVFLIPSKYNNQPRTRLVKVFFLKTGNVRDGVD